MYYLLTLFMTSSTR